MAISFVAQASTHIAYGATVTVNKPTGTIEDDLMIAVVGGLLSSTPSGWTSLQAINDGASPGHDITILYKVAGASEGASYVFDVVGTGYPDQASIITYRGVDTTTPIADDNCAADSGTAYNSASVTAVSGDEWFVSYAQGYNFDDLTAHGWTADSGTERADFADTLGDPATVTMCWYDSNGAIGSSGAKTRTHTVSKSMDTGYSGGLLLNPAVTTVTGVLDADAPAVTADINGGATADGVLDVNAPAATGDFTDATFVTGTFAASAPVVEADIGGAIYAQISYIGESHAPGYGTSYSNDVTIDVPAGVEEGDVLLAFVGGTRSGGVPSGWTEIFSEDHGASGGTAYLYWRVATASEPASYTFDLSGEFWSSAAIMVAYRGVDESSPIADFSSQADSGTSFNPAAVTAGPGDWVVSMASQYTFSGAQSSWTANNGTERADFGASIGSDQDASMCWYDSDDGVTAGDYSRVHTASSSTSVGVTGMVALARAELPVEGVLAAGFGREAMPTVSFEGEASTGGVLAASAPAAEGDIQAAVSQEVDGALTASAPAVEMEAEGGSPNTGTLSASAPAVVFSAESETRIFGERVVAIDAEDRTTYVPEETDRVQTVAAEERLTAVPQDKPTERFEV